METKETKSASALRERERCEVERRIPSTRSNLVISAKIFAKFQFFTANCHRERSTPFASRFLHLCFLWEKYPSRLQMRLPTCLFTVRNFFLLSSCHLFSSLTPFLNYCQDPAHFLGFFCPGIDYQAFRFKSWSQKL